MSQPSHPTPTVPSAVLILTILANTTTIYLIIQARNLVVILDSLVLNFLDTIMDFMKTTFSIVLPSQDTGSLENLKKGGSLITWYGAFVVFPEHFLWGGVAGVGARLGKELKQYDQIRHC